MFVLAVASHGYIYRMHNKVYRNQKQAENALKKLIDQGKLSNDTKVYEVLSWNLKEV